jgi:hypothetical protein
MPSASPLSKRVPLAGIASVIWDTKRVDAVPDGSAGHPTRTLQVPTHLRADRPANGRSGDSCGAGRTHIGS